MLVSVRTLGTINDIIQMTQIIRLDKSAQVIWTVSLVIAGYHFDLPHLFVLLYIGLSKHTHTRTSVG